MEQLLGEMVIPARSGHNLKKGEELKLIEIAGTCITFRKLDGAEIVIDIKNRALIEITKLSISIYEPICREITLREKKLLKKTNRLFRLMKRKPEISELKTFWEIEEFLKENEASYLSGFNLEEHRVLQDGMICDFSVKGELKYRFQRLCSGEELEDGSESRSIVEASCNAAKQALDSWMDIVNKNEADIFKSLE